MGRATRSAVKAQPETKEIEKPKKRGRPRKVVEESTSSPATPPPVVAPTTSLSGRRSQRIRNKSGTDTPELETSTAAAEVVQEPSPPPAVLVDQPVESPLEEDVFGIVESLPPGEREEEQVKEDLIETPDSPEISIEIVEETSTQDVEQQVEEENLNFAHEFAAEEMEQVSIVYYDENDTILSETGEAKMESIHEEVAQDDETVFVTIEAVADSESSHSGLPEVTLKSKEGTSEPMDQSEHNEDEEEETLKELRSQVEQIEIKEEVVDDTSHAQTAEVTEQKSPEPMLKDEPVESPSEPIKDECSPKEDTSSSDAVTKESKQSEESTSVRRSRRIKTISSKNVRSVGHGLVKDKEKFLKMSYSGDSIDSKPPPPPPPEHPTPSVADEPMKVKSRWRRLSEFEMATTEQEKSDTVPNVETPVDSAEDSKLIEERLRQFTQIKENEYKCERNISKEAKKMTCDCFLTPEEYECGELGCGEDCLNRMLMIECGGRCNVGERCTNKRFQKMQYSECRVFRTEKKGFGIQAAVDIQGGDFIMEYVGEVLNSKQFEKRAKEYSKDKNIHYYFMALRSDAVIDATTRGNISRFINHSCDPNAETQKWTINGELRIGFFSTRFIPAGEEVTFDYQFQRYGREAQKCFCESANCRGWIGQGPESDEEYESAEEGSAEESADEEVGTIEEKAPDLDSSHESVSSGVSVEKVTRKAPARKPRRRTRRKQRQEILDDLDLDDEIEVLSRSGLKNQAHTLKLSRLMVRSKAMEARSRLLYLLLHGELPCRRLFLDYHGLRLLHGWMEDSTTSQDPMSLQFRVEILEVLEALPIPNKTMLKDSKVLSMVENWAEEISNALPAPSPQDSSSGSGTGTPIEVKKTDLGPELLKKIPDLIKEDVEVKMEVVETPQESSEQQPKETVEAPPEVKEEPLPEQPKPEPDSAQEVKDIKQKIHDISIKLLETWSILKEVFRIPKKERIEQMKEHEREADLRYQSLKLADEDKPASNERFSGRFRDRRPPIEFNKDQMRREAPPTPLAHLNKQQRRHLFEMKVAQEEAEKRNQEMWFCHEQNCLKFGLNPRMIAPNDVPAMMNPITGQYFSIDRRPLPTPPSHQFMKIIPPPLSTNPEDYELPQMDLPPFWKFAIDERGRIYYYHIKIRISQWTPPIKIQPLNNVNSEGESVNDDASDSDDGTESSTTDTRDSSEDELEQKLEILKRCQARSKNQFNIDDLLPKPGDLEDSVADTIPTAEETTTIFNAQEKVDKLNSSIDFHHALNEVLPNLKRIQRKRTGLVQERAISPRTEEDKIRGQMEMKRYRETKEKLRRRKEEAKRRQLMGEPPIAESDPGEGPSTSGELLPRIVDELDILQSNEAKKNSVYEEWKKQEQKIRAEKKRIAAKAVKPPVKRRKVVELPNVVDPNSDEARKIKDKFRSDIAGIIVTHLSPYRKETCTIGKIINNDDFKHLARKLTHFVMLKELKHCDNTVGELEVTDSVKNKAREFIKKYMAKYGSVYIRPENDPEFKDF